MKTNDEVAETEPELDGLEVDKVLELKVGDEDTEGLALTLELKEGDAETE